MRQYAVSGAIWFTLIGIPVSFLLLMFGFSFDPSPRQGLAMGLLGVIGFPSIIILGPLEDLDIIPFGLLVATAFPLNGVFWGCVYWFFRRNRHHAG